MSSMFQNILSFSSISIQTLSLMVTLAFLAMGFVYWRKTKEEHYDEAEAFDGFLLAWIVGLVAARVGFVVLNLGTLGFNLVNWFDLVGRPGLNGLAGGIGASWYLYRFAQKKKWDAFEILDYWFLALSQGLIWVWLGLFLDGTRFGEATSLPIGMVFPGVFEPHHPAQLYAATFYSGLFWYLSWLEFNYRTFEWYKARRKSAQTGFLTGTFLIGHGVISGGLALIMPANVLIQGFELDYGLAVASVLIGGGVLMIRSGRLRNVFKRS